jgi:hypothetical protein
MIFDHFDSLLFIAVNFNSNEEITEDDLESHLEDKRLSPHDF